MKHRLFVEQPNIKMKVGIQVTKNTELIYKNEKVEQVIKNLQFDTITQEKGTNGVNSYETKSLIKIELNAGDILLFDKKRGYYLPCYPMSTIEDAIGDMESLAEFNEMEVDESVFDKEEANNDIKGNEKDSIGAD